MLTQFKSKGEQRYLLYDGKRVDSPSGLEMMDYKSYLEVTS